MNCDGSLVWLWFEQGNPSHDASGQPLSNKAVKEVMRLHRESYERRTGVMHPRRLEAMTAGKQRQVSSPSDSSPALVDSAIPSAPVQRSMDSVRATADVDHSAHARAHARERDRD